MQAPSTNVDLTDHFETVRQWFRDADFVLVGAGAGMSVEAGNDYNDKVDFARRFPAMVERGFTHPYQLVGFHDWESPELMWGYLGMHMNHVLEMPPHEPTYGALLRLLRGKDTFVVTSNVDEFFVKNGFDPARIYTPQGSFNYIQCLKPCRADAVWPAKDALAAIKATVDLATQCVPSKSVPTCPHCGGATMANVRGGSWFLETQYKAGQDKLAQWLAHVEKELKQSEATAAPKTLLVLDLGCGFNTPTVVRLRTERIAARLAPRARFVRVNPVHAFMHYPGFEQGGAAADCAVALPTTVVGAMKGLQGVTPEIEGEGASVAVEGSHTLVSGVDAPRHARGAIADSNGAGAGHSCESS